MLKGITLAASMLLSFALGCSNGQAVYIEKARVVPCYDDNLLEVNHNKEATKLLLGGHCIAPGDNVVILMRKFDIGSIFTIDDEAFEKLTIEISKPDNNTPLHLDSDDVHLYYSTGGSGWITKGYGVYSDAASGSLKITRRDEDSISLDLNLVTKAISARELSNASGDVHIRGQYQLKKKNLNDLTPWLGAPGASPGQQVYPDS